jgi:[NiFe] hydrogenase diaphorase moiety large subunit
MSTRQSERPDAGPNPAPRADIKDICASFGNDRHRMLDILLCVQEAERQISADAIRTIAAATGASPIEVEGVASFYAFLSLSPKGRVTIRLCDDIIDRHAGLAAVQAAFEAGLGIAVGQTSADGAFSLECTPCIGMCDQAPAAMINDVVLTRLTPGKVAEIVTALKAGSPPGALIDSGFDDLDPHAQARAMVENNLRQPGDVLLGDVPIRGRSEGRAGNDGPARSSIASRPAASGAAAARAIPPGPSGGTRRRRRRSGASSSAMPTRGSRGPSRTVFS